MPLSARDLRGQAVVVEFRVFGCVSCQRSILLVAPVAEKFAGRSFTVVGIRTPEFEHERNRGIVTETIARLGITHPVMLDNDFMSRGHGHALPAGVPRREPEGGGLSRRWQVGSTPTRSGESGSSG